MKKVLIGCGVVVLIILIVLANIRSDSDSAFSRGREFDVRVRPVKRGNISSTVTVSGIVEETEKENIYFDVPLRVKSLTVEKNQKVLKGQKIVEFDMSSLNNELEELKMNKQIQELNIKKLGITYSTKSLDSLKSNIDLSDMGVENAERLLGIATESYEKNKRLYDANAISYLELENSKNLKIEAEMSLNSALKNKKSAEENLKEAEKTNFQIVENKNLELKMIEKSLKSIDNRIRELETKIKNIIDNTYSPINGVITDLNLEEGSFINTAILAFRVVNLEEQIIKISIQESYIRDIDVGQDVIITGDSIRKEDEVIGIVESISPIAIKKILTSGEETFVEAYISIKKNTTTLRTGAKVNCEIITKVNKDALIVSFDMLIETADGSLNVFVVDENNIIHQNSVKLGIVEDLNAEVLEGLNEGDLAVIFPRPNLVDGTKARITYDE